MELKQELDLLKNCLMRREQYSIENASTWSDISSDVVHKRFRTYLFSEEFVEKQFENYKERHSDEDERTQRENYQKILDDLFQNNRADGAKVFCICCGGGKRSPLRKWKNVYICSNCWKIKERIGEEQFEKALRGISE